MLNSAEDLRVPSTLTTSPQTCFALPIPTGRRPLGGHQRHRVALGPKSSGVSIMPKARSGVTT